MSIESSNIAPECEKINTSDLAKELAESECHVLAGVMTAGRFADGETLTKKGDKNSALYVLINGRLDVLGESDGQEVKVYTMEPGECSGTRAFVDRKSRMATVRAVGDTLVYMLEPDDFETLLDSHPKIVYKVMRAIFRITHNNLLKMNQQSQQLSNYISKTGGRY